MTTDTPIVIALLRVREYLTPPQSWCKLAAVGPAGSRCLGYTIEREIQEPIRRYVTKRVIEAVLRRGFEHIIAFNDYHTTTHEEVLSVLDEAIARERGYIKRAQ